MDDVIVIGGSYAGMAAALQLLRTRRRVMIVDAGQRRNRFASHSHGFLGQDGVDPAEIWATARKQLAAYPTLTWVEGEALSISGQKDDFSVETTAGVLRGRRVLVATGVADQLPEIEGLPERWGKSIFHCPYCHGYELGQGRIGVIATGPMSLHQGELLTEWGEVTFLTNGAIELDAEQGQALEVRGATVEDAPISRITGIADVELADGRQLPFAGLFTATRVTPASPVAEAAGCTLMETPVGLLLQTNEAKETTVPGIFACGDVARAPHSVSLAVGDGAWAGAQIHRSLVWG